MFSVRTDTATYFFISDYYALKDDWENLVLSYNSVAVLAERLLLRQADWSDVAYSMAIVLDYGLDVSVAVDILNDEDAIFDKSGFIAGFFGLPERLVCAAYRVVMGANHINNLIAECKKFSAVKDEDALRHTFDCTREFFVQNRGY